MLTPYQVGRLLGVQYVYYHIGAGADMVSEKIAYYQSVETYFDALPVNDFLQSRIGYNDVVESAIDLMLDNE